MHENGKDIDFASKALTASGPDTQSSPETNDCGRKAIRTEEGFVSSNREVISARNLSSNGMEYHHRDNEISQQQSAETTEQTDIANCDADEYGSSASPLLTLCRIDLLDCAVETDSCPRIRTDSPQPCASLNASSADEATGRTSVSPPDDDSSHNIESVDEDQLASGNAKRSGQSIRDTVTLSQSFESNRKADRSEICRAVGAGERKDSTVPDQFREAKHDFRPADDVQLDDCTKASGEKTPSISPDLIKNTRVADSQQTGTISLQSTTASCQSSVSPAMISSQSPCNQRQMQLSATIKMLGTDTEKNRTVSLEEAACMKADTAASKKSVLNGSLEMEEVAVDDSRSDIHVTKPGQHQSQSRLAISNMLKGQRIQTIKNSPLTPLSFSIASSSVTSPPAFTSLTSSSSYPAAVSSSSFYSSDRRPGLKPQVELPLILSVVGGAASRPPNATAVRLSTALLPKPFFLRQSSSSSSSFPSCSLNPHPVIRPVTPSPSSQSVTPPPDRSSLSVNGVANVCQHEVISSRHVESNLGYRADTPNGGVSVSSDHTTAVRVNATSDEPDRPCNKQNSVNWPTGIRGLRGTDFKDEFQDSSLFLNDRGCASAAKSASNIAEVQLSNSGVNFTSWQSPAVKLCWQSSLPIWTPRPFQPVISPTVTSPSDNSPIRPATLVNAVTETVFSPASREGSPAEESVAEPSAATFRPPFRCVPPATTTPPTELLSDAVTSLIPVTPASVQDTPGQSAAFELPRHDLQQLSPTVTADRDRELKAGPPIVCVDSRKLNVSSASLPAVGLSALRALSSVLREQDNDESLITSTAYGTSRNSTTAGRQAECSPPAMAAATAAAAAAGDRMPRSTLKTGRSARQPQFDASKPESVNKTSASEPSVHISMDVARTSTEPTANEVELKTAKEVTADGHIDPTECFGHKKSVDNPKQRVAAAEETGVKLEVSMLKGAFGVGFCIEGGTDSPTGSSPVKVKRIFKADCCLRQGDVIESVNGTSFAEISHFDAWKFLKSLPAGQITFRINRK